MYCCPESLLLSQESWLERDLLQILHLGEPTLNCVRVLEIRNSSLSSSRQRRGEEDETRSWVEAPARQSTGLADGSQHIANTKPGAHITFSS